MVFKLKNRDKIYLYTKNSKIEKINKKPNYTKIKSFFINTRNKIVTYKLKLPKKCQNIPYILYINIKISKYLYAYIENL